MQHRILIAPPVAIAGLLSSNLDMAAAHVIKTEGYAYDSTGALTRDMNGHCIRAKDWATAVEIPGCDGKPVAAMAKADEKPADADGGGFADRMNNSPTEWSMPMAV